MLEAPGLPQYGYGSTPGVDIERSVQYAIDRGDRQAAESWYRLLQWRQFQLQAQSTEFQQGMTMYAAVKQQQALTQELREKEDARVAAAKAYEMVTGNTLPEDVKRDATVAGWMLQSEMDTRRQEKQIGAQYGLLRQQQQSDWAKMGLQMYADANPGLFAALQKATTDEEREQALYLYPSTPDELRGAIGADLALRFGRTGKFEDLSKAMTKVDPLVLRYSVPLFENARDVATAAQGVTEVYTRAGAEAKELRDAAKDIRATKTAVDEEMDKRNEAKAARLDAQAAFLERFQKDVLVRNGYATAVAAGLETQYQIAGGEVPSTSPTAVWLDRQVRDSFGAISVYEKGDKFELRVKKGIFGISRGESVLIPQRQAAGFAVWVKETGKTDLKAAGAEWNSSPISGGLATSVRDFYIKKGQEQMVGGGQSSKPLTTPEARRESSAVTGGDVSELTPEEQAELDSLEALARQGGVQAKLGDARSQQTSVDKSLPMSSLDVETVEKKLGIHSRSAESRFHPGKYVLYDRDRVILAVFDSEQEYKDLLAFAAAHSGEDWTKDFWQVYPRWYETQKLSK